MKKLLVIFCILSLIAMAAWKATEGWRKKSEAETLIVRSSDAAKFDRTVKILGDDWLGYCVFRSREFQKALEKQGIGVVFEMEFDFQKRFRALADGECDFVAATVDSYLVNGKDLGFPGVVTFLIDESFGGDAVVAREGISSLDALNKPGVKGAFVGFSPSEFLLKSQIAHFQLGELKKKAGKFRADSAEEVYRKLADGNVDFAVLWEPYVSRSLQEIGGATKLIDTSKARGIILDVAIASRKLVTDEPEVATAVTSAYFEALQYYLNDREAFVRLAQADSKKGAGEAGQMLAGIRFATFQSNCSRWFPVAGGGEEGLREGIGGITRILTTVGDLDLDPLEGQSQKILNSRFLTNIYADGARRAALTQGAAGASGFANKFFRPLDAPGWKKLSENITGTLMEKPVTFGSGQATIPDEFKEELGVACKNLVHYPEHRLIVQAHVSAGSDPEIDRSLSQERADAIRDYLVSSCGITDTRVYAEGQGSLKPLERLQGESVRAWKRRCRRAKIFIAPE